MILPAEPFFIPEMDMKGCTSEQAWISNMTQAKQAWRYVYQEVLGWNFFLCRQGGSEFPGLWIRIDVWIGHASQCFPHLWRWPIRILICVELYDLIWRPPKSTQYDSIPAPKNHLLGSLCRLSSRPSVLSEKTNLHECLDNKERTQLDKLTY